MIDECMAGNIDIVVTKAISRFARNTMDCLKYVRMLKERGIAVIFEKENVDTLDSKGEFLLTILASLAQEEAANISKQTHDGYRYRFEAGKVMVNTTRFLGYDKAMTESLL